jgi:acetyltransferase-like isoleucine patch superfamily enzyme
MNNSFYSEVELHRLGFKELGQNVLISRKASIYSPENISIGNHVRIDDFCILSGNIKLNNYIHISAFTALYGKFGIEMEDYSGLSPRCTIFSASDDFSGNFLIGPMVDKNLTNVTGGLVLIKMFAQLGAGCIVMPNLTIGQGVAVGSMSLVINELPDWTICYGVPAKIGKIRNKDLLKLI